MNLFITQIPRWLIKNLLLLGIFVLASCQNDAGGDSALAHGRLATLSGEVIKVEIARTDKEQKAGLSAKKKGYLKPNQGMLFVYNQVGFKGFWMPDTYFDLDIIYLDKDLKVVSIARKVPHHPGRNEPPAIARVKPVKCQHVLEMDASSPISQRLKVGQSLKWLEKKSLFEIGLKTHP
jgi:uncharacterized membrane protein (UPF0127 family)